MDKTWMDVLVIVIDAIVGVAVSVGIPMLFSLLNLAYAWFQDRITFPRTFCDYETYRERVPFLIPTGNSIRLARQTWNR